MSVINTLDGLLEYLGGTEIVLMEEQVSWFLKAEGSKTGFLPFRASESFLSAAVKASAHDRAAILNQVIPDIREFETKDYELEDPLGEHKFSPLSRMIHRYTSRVLILVTDQCAMFCRHCFRRSFSGGMHGRIPAEELEKIAEYLEERSEVTEVLLSGGDPLTLSDSALIEIISRLKKVRPEIIIRLCSRVPVVKPERVTAALTEALSGFSGIWLVSHINHPAELTGESAAAFTLFRKAGIPILSQTVLLRGVNDQTEVLAGLFNKLLQNGIKPYYLFQGDLAAGTSHLRVPLRRSLAIVSELKKSVSGMAMPRFAVDLPGGGGKITLPAECSSLIDEGEYYKVKGTGNEEYRYPAN